MGNEDQIDIRFIFKLYSNIMENIYKIWRKTNYDSSFSSKNKVLK